MDIYLEYTEKLEKLGYINPQIAFSGFWSQGDGASFTCEVDLETWIKGKDKYKPLSRFISDAEIEATVTRLTSRFSHENTCRAEVAHWIDNIRPKTGALIYQLEAELEAERLELCKSLHKDLEEECEHLSSDECIAENFEANEVEFLEDGSVYHI